jgi:hypothetical protein
VRPTEALVYRRLTGPGPASPLAGTVVAVACGEAATWISAYDVERSESALRITALATGQCPVGSWPVSAALARLVLERCREGVPATALLALLDGGLELGAVLRAHASTDEVTWDGPLTDRMFAPLRLSGAGMAGWPEVSSATGAIAELVGSVCAGRGAGPPQILVGGIGAVWPFVADALREVGSVWQSQDPAIDVAVGAAWSPWLRAEGRVVLAGAEAATGAAAGPGARPPEPAAQSGSTPRPPEADSAEIPPWLRDV